MPGNETWAALEAAAVRVAPEMNAQSLANTLWAHAALSTLRDVNLPLSHAALWELVCDMEERDLADEELQMLFHVHLMHSQFLSAQATANVQTPGWLMVEARDAWTRSVRDDITVSKFHRELAQIFDELGVRHEVEHITDDGCFSFDIYLPEHDTAVEVDGPSHYYYDRGSPASSTVAARRTAKTELRDLFLAQRCAKVLTVPWFEVATSKEKRISYVREMLTKEGLL